MNLYPSDADFLTRRTFIKTGAAAGVGVLALSATACEKKDVDFYINTVTTALDKLKPLLPNQATLLSKAISIAKEVNEAYQDGRFDSALSLLSNLTTTINDVIAAAGVGLSDSAKIVIAIVDVALTAAVVLIEGSIPASQQNKALSPEAEKVKALASPKRVNAIFEASRL